MSLLFSILIMMCLLQCVLKKGCLIVFDVHAHIYCLVSNDAGGWQHAKDNGVVKMQGKDYIVQDGDVIIFHTSK